MTKLLIVGEKAVFVNSFQGYSTVYIYDLLRKRVDKRRVEDDFGDHKSSYTQVGDRLYVRRSYVGGYSSDKLGCFNELGYYSDWDSKSVQYTKLASIVTGYTRFYGTLAVYNESTIFNIGGST